MRLKTVHVIYVICKLFKTSAKNVTLKACKGICVLQPHSLFLLHCTAGNHFPKYLIYGDFYCITAEEH